jgi:2-polyprenyl-6-methoxyphenol hydroxylase-like FAD-dependent oxidoreductase
MSADADSNVPAVLIVGAGPTGLTAAMSLARLRIPVRLIDKAPRPSPSSRAIGIQARTLELLEQHRVVEPFLALGHRARAANLYSNGHRLARLDFDPLQTRYPYLLFLDQSVTERLLAEHLATLGVTVERGVALTGLTQGASTVEVALSHADGRVEVAHAAYLIGADGAHSAVRHRLNVGFAGKTFEQTFLLADLQAQSDWPDDEFHLFASSAGLVGLFPMGAGRHRLIADHPPSLGAGADAATAATGHLPRETPPLSAPSLDECRQVIAQRVHGRIELEALAWSSYFHVNSRMAERLRAQRVFLAGDAAHVHSPAGAQGMNTGIQEAFNLGWKLARRISAAASDPLLDTYQIERRPIERGVLRQTSFMTQMAEAGHGPFKLLREHVIPVLAALGPLRDAARLTLSELAVQHRHSPLTLERVLDGGPSAGERAPDALVHVIDGPLGRAPGIGRIFDLHDPAFFSLFLLVTAQEDADAPADAAPAPDAEVARLTRELERVLPGAVRIWRVAETPRDGAPSLSESYGRTRPAFYLVRPDGYLCARGRPASDGNALIRHCETWFGRPREHG